MPPAKSMYSLPSTSTSRAPWACAAKIGCSETHFATYWSRWARSASVRDPETETAIGGTPGSRSFTPPSIRAGGIPRPGLLVALAGLSKGKDADEHARQPAAAGDRQAAPDDALHPARCLPHRGRAGDHPRRGLLALRLDRQEVLRRAVGPVLHAARLQPRRRAGRGRRAADGQAAVLHELKLRAPAGDRAGRRGRLAGAGRPEPRLLRVRRLRGERVDHQAGQAVPPAAWA